MGKEESPSAVDPAGGPGRDAGKVPEAPEPSTDEGTEVKPEAPGQNPTLMTQGPADTAQPRVDLPIDLSTPEGKAAWAMVHDDFAMGAALTDASGALLGVRTMSSVTQNWLKTPSRQDEHVQGRKEVLAHLKAAAEAAFSLWGKMAEWYNEDEPGEVPHTLGAGEEPEKEPADIPAEASTADTH